jgi:hypothetical protein
VSAGQLREHAARLFVLGDEPVARATHEAIIVGVNQALLAISAIEGHSWHGRVARPAAHLRRQALTLIYRFAGRAYFDPGEHAAALRRDLRNLQQRAAANLASVPVAAMASPDGSQPAAPTAQR